MFFKNYWRGKYSISVSLGLFLAVLAPLFSVALVFTFGNLPQVLGAADHPKDYLIGTFVLLMAFLLFFVWANVGVLRSASRRVKEGKYIWPLIVRMVVSVFAGLFALCAYAIIDSNVNKFNVANQQRLRAEEEQRKADEKRRMIATLNIPVRWKSGVVGLLNGTKSTFDHKEIRFFQGVTAVLLHDCSLPKSLVGRAKFYKFSMSLVGDVLTAYSPRKQNFLEGIFQTLGDSMITNQGAAFARGLNCNSPSTILLANRLEKIIK